MAPDGRREQPDDGILNGSREALLGNTDWSLVWKVVIPLLPLSAITLTLGTVAFRLALTRERRRGTLGLY